MADLPKYHIGAQQADALLAPVDATLGELEHRVQHYLDRLALGTPDADALRKAHAVLAAASRDIARLLDESRQIAR
ncbi:MAG: hypothetical protein ACR2JW_07920 [Thermomicrobiales bacterium]